MILGSICSSIRTSLVLMRNALIRTALTIMINYPRTRLLNM